MNEIVNIPITKIQPRNYNGYPLVNIGPLAESIERCGVLQPIIVRPKDDGFQIVAGERRYTAVRFLQDKYKDDPIRAEIFSTIPCLLFDGTDEEEETVYQDTNRYSRQLNNFQRIIQCDPDAIDMNLSEWQDRYRELVLHGSDEPVKVSRRSKSRLIQAMIQEVEPDVDISLKTITNYLAFWDRCTSELKMAVAMGRVAIRDAEMISWNRPGEQTDALRLLGQPGFKDYVYEGRVASGTEERKRRRARKNSGTLRQSFTRRLGRIVDEADLDDLKIAPEDEEYYEQLKIVFEEIGKLRKK